jgi:hypothetical protein
MGKTVKLKMTRELWEQIGEKAGWAQDIGFGLSQFKFKSGPGAYCVCPFCGHMKKHVRMMPCKRMKCPRCMKGKMEQRYVSRDGRQMSPDMY